MNQREVLIFKALDKTEFQIEVRVEDDTFWLNRQQIAALFDREVNTVSKHIVNVLKVELQSVQIVTNFATASPMNTFIRSNIMNKMVRFLKNNC